MILIFEQDKTIRNGKRFTWRPLLFRGTYANGRTWRLCWGLWSISYYPAPGLRSFLDHVAAGKGIWESNDGDFGRPARKILMSHHKPFTATASVEHNRISGWDR